MRTRLISVAAVGAVLVSAAGASAQMPQDTRPERPYRGMYASGTDQAEQAVTVGGGVGTGYDSSAQLSSQDAGLGTFREAVPAVGSTYNQVNADLSYSASLPKWSGGGSLSTTARQYPQLDMPITLGHGASGGLSVQLGKRTSLNGDASATFSSVRGFAPFATIEDPVLGQIDAPTPDLGSTRARYHTLSTNIGVTQQLSRSNSLIVAYDRQTSDFVNGIEDLSQQSGSVRFTHSLNRYLGLRLGYGYTEARYGVLGRSYQHHNIDTGVDYSRDLSLTRRTRLSFATGASALKQEDVNRVDVTGTVTLSREIGRTWVTSATYNRNVGFLETVAEPVFYDSVSAGVRGLISRRVSFNSGVSGTLGSVGVVQRPQNGFDAWNGYAGIRTAFTRHLSLSVNYTFYRYNFDPGAALATTLLPQMNRHSVNVMLNAWAPVFQHGRKKNATR